MDFNVFKSKFTKSEPAPTPKPAPPLEPTPEPPSPPYQGPAYPRPTPGPMPFMGGDYMEELDQMSRIPGMRNFEVTYSKTYRRNLMDPMEDYEYDHYQDHGQPMAYRGMQWLPPPYMAQALPPWSPRRPLGFQLPEYGPPVVLQAPPHHASDYPCLTPTYVGHHLGPYRGGGGYYGDLQPEDCRFI